MTKSGYDDIRAAFAMNEKNSPAMRHKISSDELQPEPGLGEMKRSMKSFKSVISASDTRCHGHSASESPHEQRSGKLGEGRLGTEIKTHLLGSLLIGRTINWRAEFFGLIFSDRIETREKGGSYRQGFNEGRLGWAVLTLAPRTSAESWDSWIGRRQMSLERLMLGIREVNC